MWFKINDDFKQFAKELGRYPDADFDSEAAMELYIDGKEGQTFLEGNAPYNIKRMKKKLARLNRNGNIDKALEILNRLVLVPLEKCPVCGSMLECGKEVYKMEWDKFTGLCGGQTLYRTYSCAGYDENGNLVNDECGLEFRTADGEFTHIMPDSCYPIDREDL